MNRWRRRQLERARPRSLEELEVLLPDAAVEEVAARRELVIYTGWHAGRAIALPRSEFADMLSEADAL